MPRRHPRRGEGGGPAALAGAAHERGGRGGRGHAGGGEGREEGPGGKARDAEAGAREGVLLLRGEGGGGGLVGESGMEEEDLADAEAEEEVGVEGRAEGAAGRALPVGPLAARRQEGGPAEGVAEEQLAWDDGVDGAVEVAG